MKKSTNFGMLDTIGHGTTIDEWLNQQRKTVDLQKLNFNTKLMQQTNKTLKSINQNTEESFSS